MAAQTTPRAAARGIDCRKWLRYPVSPAVRVHLTVESPRLSWPVEALNLSAGGISLALGQRIEPETVATLKVYNPLRGCWFKPKIRVVYVLERPARHFILGGVFLPQLTEDALRGLVDPAGAVP